MLHIGGGHVLRQSGDRTAHRLAIVRPPIALQLSDPSRLEDDPLRNPFPDTSHSPLLSFVPGAVCGSLEVEVGLRRKRFHSLGIGVRSLSYRSSV